MNNANPCITCILKGLCPTGLKPATDTPVICLQLSTKQRPVRHKYTSPGLDDFLLGTLSNRIN